jgi:hypothetical protein
MPRGDTRQRSLFLFLTWLASLAFLMSSRLAEAQTGGQAQGATGQASCTQPPQLGGQARGARGPANAGQRRAQAPRSLATTAIPGVVAEGGTWTKIWQAAGNSADGIIPDKDGSVLVAQEDYDGVLKIDTNGRTSVVVENAKGIGSLSMDRQGRLYGAHRTERPGSTKPDRASIVNAITLLRRNAGRSPTSGPMAEH